MKTYTVWLALSIDAICQVGQALGGDVQCPATIAVDQKITNTPPHGAPAAAASPALRLTPARPAKINVR